MIVPIYLSRRVGEELRFAQATGAESVRVILNHLENRVPGCFETKDEIRRKGP